MIVFVARDAQQAHNLRPRLRHTAKVIHPSASELTGWFADTIFILPGVDLSQQIEGITLENHLRRAQAPYRNATIIEIGEH